jgi:hypothetical protein
VLRTVCDRPTLWEALLPAVALVMPADLAAVDRLLDDPSFFDPFRCWFDPVWGAAVDSDRDLPAVDVPQVPLPARL